MKKIVCALGACLMMAGAAQATVLATYEFEAGSLVASDELYADSAGDILLSTKIAANSANSNLEVSTAVIDTNITLNGTIFSFIYTVTGLEEGQTLDLDSASIDYTGQVGSTRMDFSEAGFVNETVSNGNFEGALTSTGLVNGDTVTIKFGMRDNDDSVAYTFDNLTLNGTVIPEPATIGMLGLGALVAFAVRKQQLG